jgi:hypothetical protein
MQRRLLASRSKEALLLAVKHVANPGGHIGIAGTQLEIEVGDGVGHRIRIDHVLVILGDGLGFGEGLHPRVRQQHRIGVAFLRVLVQARPHKVARRRGVAFYREIRGLTFYDGLRY